MHRERPVAGRPITTIAYVLKSFPRVSETFIASEIYRLEQLGVRLHLFIIKRSDDAFEHPIVGAIQAPRTHLPHTAPISATSARRWLRTHLARFAAALGRVLVQHPFGTVRAAAAAFGHAVRARHGRWGALRRSPLKEFLQAVAVADGIDAAGNIAHIHAHFCHSATTVAWLASKITGLPLSFTAHAKDVYCNDLNPAGLLERKLAAARFVVTCTDANREYLQSRTSIPVHCLYHGLDVEFARLCGAVARGTRSPVLRVLAVGRLVPKKGFDVLLHACARLRQRGLAVHATIVGESGEHEPTLRALASSLGLEDSVTFTGAMRQADLVKAYADATVFCLPCRVLANGDRDGIPNVVAEAMACGLPVVTTNVSGIKELLEHGVNGLIVPPDDPVAVANALERIHMDPKMAATVGQAAQAQIRATFDGDASALRLSSLLLSGGV
jgi:glycosyltransferase involved in cell wall biosynthesis